MDEMTFKSVGLTARTDKKEALVLAEKLFNHASEKGLTVILDSETAKQLNQSEVAAIPLKEWHPDFIITIGGDGTILRTCISIPKPEPPILAINMGERGFLAEVQPKDAISAFDRIVDGKYDLEYCWKLSASIEEEELPDALNEVYISADAPVKLLYTNLLKDKTRILSCRADAILVASPTGSTGYSIAAGGPVLDPQSKVFVVTPVCPLTQFPPIVLSETSTFSIEIERPNTIQIVIDGYYRKFIKKMKPKITIRKSDQITSFIRFRREFYSRLKERLLYPKEADCC
jgi:NAD+ kinase